MKNQSTATAGKFLFPILFLFQLSVTKIFAQTVPSANSFSSYLPYNNNYRYGMNPGYYGGNWTTQNIAALSMGDSSLGVNGVGAKTVRVPLYDDFLTTWGLTNLLGDYQYFNNLGASEITAFVGHPHASHQLDTTFPGASEKSKVFAGMYEPVWLDSAHTQINPANTYAKYLYDVVKTYGQYVKFWEIVNEPDFTYSPAGWYGDSNPVIAGSWYDHNPTADELVNFRAPIFYYIRMLRISWDVVKKLAPNSYVCTGGIGYKSFLDALLRNTDNPVDGSVTPDFPLKAGAYFDILSFHNYPMFQLKYWDAASGSTKYNRHSDAAANAFIGIKNNMDSTLQLYGYDGTTYPKKQFICTETGVSRIMGGQDWGSNEGQKNYMIKAQVAAQKSGIKQTYWFQLGDGANPNEQFDQMGLYYYFGQANPYNAKVTDQGIALKTTSDLLFGNTYDPAKTASLNMPSSIDGGAFKVPDGSYVYVLWAKTNTDLSESASATYSFPSTILKNNLIRKEWNFSDADTSDIIAKTNIVLTASPSFFIETNAIANQNPKVSAGPDQIIKTHIDSIQLIGSAVDLDGSISTYKWTKISGPSQYTIGSPNQAQTLIRNLVTGVYTFRLTATDNMGATGIDDITITVPVLLPSKIEAESYIAMSGVQTENAWGDPLGGGLHVGWIDQGDWMDYLFYVPAATYKLNMRIASAQDEAQFQIKKSDGTIIKTINVPNTGGWQTWQTISDTITLSEGLQTIRLQSSAASNWNINWFEFLHDSTLSTQPPTVNAGKNQIILLPVDSVTLSGSATDSGAIITSYAWSQVAGPANAIFNNNTLPSTAVKNLIQGIYTFRLTITDNRNATAYSDVTVTVNAAPVNQIPVVNAGADKTITLPTNFIQLNGSATDSDGTITKYDWTKISGPAGSAFSNDTTASTSVTNLVAGTYTFRLTVTDNAGAKSSDDVVVTVNPSPSFKIEAESYSSMNGVTIQTTQDTGGGSSVTDISTNDWMDYPVNILYSGTYTVNFRIACTKPATKIQLKKADGTVLTTVTVPNTGGLQTWQTISTTITLSQGQQTLRIFANKITGNLNINWWELILNTPGTTNSIATSTSKPSNNTGIDNGIISSNVGLQFYPSPVLDQAYLKVNNSFTGNLKVQVINITGALEKEFILNKTSDVLQATLNLANLTKGNYVLLLTMNGWTGARQIIKQ